MKDLKVGDRVAVYTLRECLDRFVGTVRQVNGCRVTVSKDGDPYLWEAHRKQCRKIKESK